MPEVRFEAASAYDFFISLIVLHNPADFGLRPSWAAGVRSRLPAAQREFFEHHLPFLGVPLTWLHDLTIPQKTTLAVLSALEQIPPAERLPRLTLIPELRPEVQIALQEIAATGRATPAIRTLLKAELEAKRHPPPAGTLDYWISAWSNPAAFGEEWLFALRTYFNLFFSEEEARLQSLLEDGVQTASRLLNEQPLPQVVETLTRGVSIAEIQQVSQLTLIPSYWSTPFIFFQRLAGQRALLVFGCRPAHLSLAGGGAVPLTLVDTFKALGDPTRLRILRFLAQQPLTPAALAERLRLRAPTVIHHLNALRRAGLVHIRLDADGERRYDLRREGLNETLTALHRFLDSTEEP
uniref:ArsR family transcriptional regulator n=1 Tax=Bellilinea caldifistulae TaxID=360411 RepID=A0A7C4L0K9_9CHLR